MYFAVGHFCIWRITNLFCNVMQYRGCALDRVQTHAGHSIAFNMFLHFVTLWPWPLAFWRNIKWIALQDSWWIGDCSFSHFDSIVWTDTQTDADERFTTVVGVNNNNIQDNIYSAVMIIVTSHYHSFPCSFNECRTAPSGCRPSDQANRLGLWVRL